MQPSVSLLAKEGQAPDYLNQNIISKLDQVESDIIHCN